MFYKSPFVCSVVGEEDQFLSLDICHPQLSTPITFADVHATSMVEEIRVIWDGLLRCKPHQRPWVVTGDFNVVVDAWEIEGEAF